MSRRWMATGLHGAAVAALVCSVAVTAPTSAVATVGPTTSSNGTVGSAGVQREPGSCYGRVDNPHYSSGAGGVIAKVRLACDVGYSTTFQSWIGNIYRCQRSPDIRAAEATWTRDSGCISVATNSSTNDGGSVGVGSGVTVTRYIPKQGQRGATRVSGAYYIACVRGYKSGNVPFAAKSGIFRG